MPLLNSYLKEKLSSDSLTTAILGTTNQITVTDNGNDTITLSLPQDYDIGATPTLGGLTIVNTITEFSTDGTLSDNSDSALPTEKAVKTYVDSLSASAPTDAQYITLATNVTLTNERALTGTANQITITDGGAGSTVTLSLPQDYHTSATPTLGGLTVTGTIDASSGTVLVDDNSTTAPTSESDGYIGVAEVSSDGRIYFKVEDKLYYISGTRAVQAGSPMGLLLALVYA